MATYENNQCWGLSLDKGHVRNVTASLKIRKEVKSMKKDQTEDKNKVKIHVLMTINSH